MTIDSFITLYREIKFVINKSKYNFSINKRNEWLELNKNAKEIYEKYNNMEIEEINFKEFKNEVDRLYINFKLHNCEFFDNSKDFKYKKDKINMFLDKFLDLDEE